MYNEINPDVIFQEMIKKVTSGTDTREGTLTWDALYPVALAMANYYFQLDGVSQSRFLDTCFGEQLDIRAEELGMKRKIGTKATGMVTITNGGQTRIEIPMGTVVYSINRKEFKTTEHGILDATLGSEIVLPIESITIGEDYNLNKNEIVGIRLNGNISKVTNKLEILGGTNDEDDNTLRDRISLRLKTPPRSGCISDYISWSREIEGVEYCIVKPIWNGPGTVKLILGGAEGSPLLPEKLAEVTRHIDNVTPIGAVVTCVNTENLTINLKITGLEVETGFSIELVKTNIENSLRKALINHEAGKKLRINDIVSVIVNTEGCLDITSLRMNDSDTNIELTEVQKPIIGQVTWL